MKPFNQRRQLEAIGKLSNITEASFESEVYPTLKGIETPIRLPLITKVPLISTRKLSNGYLQMHKMKTQKHRIP